MHFCHHFQIRTASWNPIKLIQSKTYRLKQYRPTNKTAVSSLVTRCFEPSQPQRITSGLNINFILSHSYSFHKSGYHKSCCCFFKPIHIPRALNTGSCIQQGDLFILPAYTGTGVSHSQRRKKLEIWKKCR